MPLTRAAIAKAWGVSAVAVGYLAKRGMPLDSLEAAERWKAENCHPGRTRGQASGERIKRANRELDEQERQLEAVDGKGWEGLDPVERLNKQRRKLESRIDFAEQEATRWRNEDPDLARKWLTLAAQLATRAPAVERQILDALERLRVLITTQDAQATFTEFLVRLRGLIDTMPASLAAKANPSDPDHALEQLTRWRDETLYKTLAGAPDVT